MIFFSVAKLIVYQQAAANKKGRGLGLYQMCYALGFVAGPIVGGFVYHHFGASILWYLCSMLGVVSLLACLHFRNEK